MCVPVYYRKTVEIMITDVNYSGIGSTAILIIINSMTKSTAILIIIESHLEVFQRFPSGKLVVKIVGSRFTALKYYGYGGTSVLNKINKMNSSHFHNDD